MRFIANVASAAGEDKTVFTISSDIKLAIDDIHRYFTAKNAQDLLYTVLINDRIYHQLIAENYAIREGDRLTILPVTLGG